MSPQPGYWPSSRLGYWPSPWPGEDGGPSRPQSVAGTPEPFTPGSLESHSREAVAATMVVLRGPGELFLLRHGIGPDASCHVERLDPLSLAAVGCSPELEGGPVWPGGLAAHANGTIYVVFGNHAHRLTPSLEVLASKKLPRTRPYNSFVILSDGSLVTKDFGGLLPGEDRARHIPQPAQLLVLDPDSLDTISIFDLPEPSIARLSADGNTVYAVGTTTLWRARLEGGRLEADRGFAAKYVTMDGQTYGWDPVIALGAVWFLDNGFGSENYAGTFRGQGANTAPLHLVRVDKETGEVTLAEICGLPNGVIANPPIVDETRHIAVGYDSGNCVLTAFDIGDDGRLTKRWSRSQNHGCHMLLFEASGEIATNDHDMATMSDDVVILDITTGEEHARVATGSPIQSVLFSAPGFEDDLYYCSFSTVARVSRRTGRLN